MKTQKTLENLRAKRAVRASLELVRYFDLRHTAAMVEDVVRNDHVAAVACAVTEESRLAVKAINAAQVEANAIDMALLEAAIAAL